MARRKSKGLFSSLDSGKRRKRKGGGLTAAFGFGKKRGRKSKGGGLTAAFATTKRRGKKGGGGLFAAFDEKPKRGRKNSSFANLFAGLFGGGDTYVDLDDRPGYDNMRQFLESHDMSTRDRNGVLFYLMHFDGQSDVKRVLSDLAGHGFQMTRNAEWAYQQWSKYQSDPNFREMLGRMGSDDTYLKQATSMSQSSGVPRGIYWFLQDKLSDIHKILG